MLRGGLGAHRRPGERARGRRRREGSYSARLSLLATTDPAAFERLTLSLCATRSIAFVTGRFDFIVELACRDTGDLDETVRQLRSQGGVTATETRTGLVRTFLLQKTDGSEHMTLYRMTVEPGDEGPGLHIHCDEDMFYFVLDGAINVQLALDEFVVPRTPLVVLPAGMPHRLWNASDKPSRHLAPIAPAAEPGVPGDIPVRFSAATPVS